LLDAFVLDHADSAAAASVEAIGIAPLVTSTVMRSDAERERLAREILDFAATLAPRRSRP
jgi:LPPG:FO 2-phospho-L-lactate transferase